MIGLPTLGQLDRSTSVRIWLATEPADMRCGFDRLAELAGSVTGDDCPCRFRHAALLRHHSEFIK